MTLEDMEFKIDLLETRLEQQADRYDGMIRELERRLGDEIYDRERACNVLEDKCGELERNLAFVR